MNQDVTILFLAIPVDNKSEVPKSFLPYSTSLITVSGVSFLMFYDPNNTKLMSVFLSFLGVTHHVTAHPPSIQSWQCNGVGFFMIIHIVKQCALNEGVTKIEMLLQCSEPSAIHFYTMIGFGQKKTKVIQMMALECFLIMWELGSNWKHCLHSYVIVVWST